MRKISKIFIPVFLPLCLYASLDIDIDSLKEYSLKNPQDYKTDLLLGSYYFESNDYNQSLYYTNLAKQIKPDNLQVKKLYEKLKKHSSDMLVLKRYNLHKNDSQDDFYKVLKKISHTDKSGDFENLLDYLIREKKPLEPRFFILSAKYMLDQKSYNKSRNLLRRCDELKQSKAYLQIDAKLCEIESDYLCSGTSYKKLGLLTKDSQNNLMAADMFLHVNDYKTAASELKSVSKSKHNTKLYQELYKKISKHQADELLKLKENYRKNQNLENLKKLCNNLHNAKRYKELSGYIQTYKKTDQEFYKYAADMAYWNSDTDKAIYYYTKLNNKDAEIFYKLGRLHSWKGSYDKALLYLDKAQKADNKNEYYYKIYRARGYIWLWNAKYDKAVKVFRALLRHSPDDAELKEAYESAISYRDGKKSIKKTAKAKPFYRLDPELQKALFYYEHKKYLESIDYFYAYLREAKDDNTSKEKYAFALQQSNQYKKAAQIYKELYSISNKKTHLHHYAYNLYKIKDYAKAQKLYEKMIFAGSNIDISQINIKDSDKNILLEYAYLLQDSGKLTKARQVYESILHPYSAKRDITKSEREFLSDWQKSWENRLLDIYVSYYKNRDKSWKRKKEILFKNSGHISVNITAPRVISSDIYEPYGKFTISFLQEYKSDILQDRGFKELDITCNEVGCLIEDERWKRFDIDAPINKFKKEAYLDLKYLDYLPLRAKKNIKKKEPVLVAKKRKREIKKSLLKEDYIAKSLNSHPVIEKETAPTKPLGGYNLGISGRNFSDNDKRHYIQTMLHAGYTFDKDMTLNGGIGAFSLRENFANSKISDTISGTSFMLELIYNSWTFGNYFEHYLDKTDIAPYLIYNTHLKSNFVKYSSLTQYLQFKLYKRNLYVSKLSTAALHKNIDKYALNISDYIEFNRFSSLWFAMDLAYITDDNHIFNLMFDYEMYRHLYKRLKYSFVLSGWYEYNKEQKIEYYSPDFDDITQLLSRAYYPLSSNLNIKAQAGVGHSFKYDKNIIQYGLWLQAPTKTDTKFILGCLKSQVINSPIEVDTLGYDYLDCKLELQHFW